MMDLLLKEEVYKVVGAAMEVYNELGAGFLEAVYQEALEYELGDRGVGFEAQRPLRIRYKQRTLNKEYVPDLVCFDQLIVEVKALDKLRGVEEAQVLNYLKATGYRVGLLINFGHAHTLEWKRFVR